MSVSDEEIEAAAIAIYKCEYHFPNWSGPTLAENTRKQYRDSARAALTAAAQVREGAMSAVHKRNLPCRVCGGTGCAASGKCYACKGSGKAIDNYEHPTATNPSLMPIYGATEKEQEPNREQLEAMQRTAAHDQPMICRWCGKMHRGGPENCNNPDATYTRAQSIEPSQGEDVLGMRKGEE